MVKFFSWMIVILIGFIIISTLTLTYFIEEVVLTITNISLVLLLISSIGLIISLVLDRIKDRKEEKDDFSKY